MIGPLCGVVCWFICCKVLIVPNSGTRWFSLQSSALEGRICSTSLALKDERRLDSVEVGWPHILNLINSYLYVFSLGADGAVFVQRVNRRQG